MYYNTSCETHKFILTPGLDNLNTLKIPFFNTWIAWFVIRLEPLHSTNISPINTIHSIYTVHSTHVLVIFCDTVQVIKFDVSFCTRVQSFNWSVWHIFFNIVYYSYWAIISHSDNKFPIFLVKRIYCASFLFLHIIFIDF